MSEKNIIEALADSFHDGVIKDIENPSLNKLIEGSIESFSVKLLHIGSARRHVLDLFDFGMSITEIGHQNDILKKASEEWLELNRIVTELKEEE